MNNDTSHEAIELRDEVSRVIEHAEFETDTEDAKHALHELTKRAGNPMQVRTTGNFTNVDRNSVAHVCGMLEEIDELRDRTATLELRHDDLLRFIEIMDGTLADGEDRQMSWRSLSESLRDMLNGKSTED